MIVCLVFVNLHFQESPPPLFFFSFVRLILHNPSWSQTHYAAKDNLELVILLSLPLKNLDHRPALPHLLYNVLGIAHTHTFVCANKALCQLNYKLYTHLIFSFPWSSLVLMVSSWKHLSRVPDASSFLSWTSEFYFHFIELPSVSQMPGYSSKNKKLVFVGYILLIEINTATKSLNYPEVSAVSTINFLLFRDKVWHRLWLAWNHHDLPASHLTAGINARWPTSLLIML